MCLSCLIEINEEQSSWGYWLWNMMPAILPQEDDEDSVLKRSEPTFSILNMGFYTQNLEIALKVKLINTFPTVNIVTACFIFINLPTLFLCSVNSTFE